LNINKGEKRKLKEAKKKKKYFALDCKLLLKIDPQEIILLQCAGHGKRLSSSNNLNRKKRN
jgi:hypothetical protein